MMEPALYQVVHVAGRRVCFLAEHLHELSAAYERLFATPWAGDAERVEQQIVRLLDDGRYPLDRSTYVTLWLDSTGELALEAEAEVLYQGLVLRALRPEALTLHFEVPFEGLPTAARLLTWQTARLMARQRGAGGVVRVDARGCLAEGDGAPLFAVVNRTLYVPQPPVGVYGRLAVEAIRRLGCRLVVEPVCEEWLGQIEELFYVDHRGVTAFSRCNDRLLLAALAARVAGQMALLG